MLLSISQIKAFKACRRAYELKYIYGLEPVRRADALEAGSRYHEFLERLYWKGEIGSEGDFSKEAAMAWAHVEHLYPEVMRIAQKVEPEKWFEKRITPSCSLRGRLDGWSQKEKIIIEHKTTSLPVWEYADSLERDEQLLAYMWMTGARRILYTVIRKPTIRQRESEPGEAYFDRVRKWYREDTGSKICSFVLFRSEEEIRDFEVRLSLMAFEIGNCENFYRNTCHCRAWGRECEYAPVCMDYDPAEEYVGFTREEI